MREKKLVSSVCYSTCFLTTHNMCIDSHARIKLHAIDPLPLQHKAALYKLLPLQLAIVTIATIYQKMSQDVKSRRVVAPSGQQSTTDTAATLWPGGAPPLILATYIAIRTSPSHPSRTRKKLRQIIRKHRYFWPVNHRAVKRPIYTETVGPQARQGRVGKTPCPAPANVPANHKRLGVYYFAQRF